MLECWEWDPHGRPSFTEIRTKLSEIFGEGKSFNMHCFWLNLWFHWIFWFIIHLFTFQKSEQTIFWLRKIKKLIWTLLLSKLSWRPHLTLSLSLSLALCWHLIQQRISDDNKNSILLPVHQGFVETVKKTDERKTDINSSSHTKCFVSISTTKYTLSCVHCAHTPHAMWCSKSQVHV